PGVLGVDPAFDGVAAELDVLLAKRQRVAARDPDLLADEIEAGDRLGHRMLDLEAGVHLDEVEFPILPEELDRAGAAIAHVGHRLADDAAHPVALLRSDDRRGRFLQNLLVAALERAVALAQVDGIALAVAEHLELDVARVAEIFFDIDGVVAEGALRLGARLADLRFELVWRIDHLHSAAAPARGGLDDQGIAGALGHLLRFGEGLDRPGGARHQRQAELGRGDLGLDLVAHRPDMLGLGADPDDVVALDD